MAQRTFVQTVDDFDPDTEAAETVAFSFDGVTYEIDLSAENAQTFRETMAPYIDAARRTGGRKRRAKGD